MTAPDQLGLAFQVPERRVWTVRDLVSALRTQLERDFPDLWVEGEISNLRAAESGHLYFTLKDDDAQLRVVMFRTQARLLRFQPENGMQVVARGRVAIYEARGDLQLSAEYLEPKGAGTLQVAFEQLKAKLAAEGLFDAARKQPIPALPRVIGVVTSPGSAALQDILNVLRRRHESVHIIVYPAQVQGEAAPAEVSAGIQYFNQAHPGRTAVDVIIVARGGGSFEDLAAFNDESLARAAAGSRLPLISAVGHETDFTILDFVADLRAPTPSAAAELVIRAKHELEERSVEQRRRLAQAMRYRLAMARQMLTERAQHGAFVGMRQALGRRQQRLDDVVYRLAAAQSARAREGRRRLDVLATRVQQHDPRRRLAALRGELRSRQSGLAGTMRTLLLERRAYLQRVAAQVVALSPLRVLERGYAVVLDRQGKAVKDAAQLRTGDTLKARFARGSAEAEVRKVVREKGRG